MLVLVTPSCLGDSQRRAVGASRWRDVFAQPVAPGEGGGGEQRWEEGRQRVTAGGGVGVAGMGEGYLPGCLSASVSDNPQSNSVNHPELRER